MAASIFISFASEDRKIATTICSALEGRGFKCWMANRDIPPGENFQVAIVRAIRQSKMMLLVFTANSNGSEEMTKELALASQQKLMVVPLRVEDVAPNDAFAYEFATRQWIDFFADWEEAINQLCARIAGAMPSELVPPAVAALVQPAAAPAPPASAAPAPVTPAPSTPAKAVAPPPEPARPSSRPKAEPEPEPLVAEPIVLSTQPRERAPAEPLAEVRSFAVAAAEDPAADFAEPAGRREAAKSSSRTVLFSGLAVLAVLAVILGVAGPKLGKAPGPKPETMTLVSAASAAPAPAAAPILAPMITVNPTPVVASDAAAAAPGETASAEAPAEPVKPRVRKARADPPKHSAALPY